MSRRRVNTYFSGEELAVGGGAAGFLRRAFEASSGADHETGEKGRRFVESVERQGGERIAARLLRGGVNAAFERLPSDEDKANALLSYIADTGAEVLVAGGYGHSRLREALFGGVTRTLLSSQTLPLFVSH